MFSNKYIFRNLVKKIAPRSIILTAGLALRVYNLKNLRLVEMYNNDVKIVKKFCFGNRGKAKKTKC